MAGATLGVPFVEVTLDRTRRMTLSLAALRRMRQATGMGLEALDKLGDDEALDHVDGVVWAMLADDDPDLTREHVARMLHFGNLPVVFGALNELAASSLPDAAEAPASDPLAQAPAKPKRKPARAKPKG